MSLHPLLVLSCSKTGFSGLELLLPVRTRFGVKPLWLSRMCGPVESGRLFHCFLVATAGNGKGVSALATSHFDLYFLARRKRSPSCGPMVNYSRDSLCFAVLKRRSPRVKAFPRGRKRWRVCWLLLYPVKRKGAPRSTRARRACQRPVRGCLQTGLAVPLCGASPVTPWEFRKDGLGSP